MSSFAGDKPPPPPPPQFLTADAAVKRARRGSVGLSAFPKLYKPAPDEEEDGVSNVAAAVEKIESEQRSGGDDEFLDPAVLMDTKDLVTLDRPTTSRVFKCLEKRFMKSKVYTNMGHCLLSINPYEWIVGLYDQNVASRYRGDFSTAKVPPHVFGVAGNAFNAFVLSERDQSILITGESGAGKTENTKKCIQYLVDVAAPGSDLEAKILSTNPILEAFGNAKTCRNDNSSRFGKWIKLSFNSRSKISDCKIVTYLLEKSRVSHQPSGERNYHIFHMMNAACSSEQRERYFLSANDTYAYIPFVESGGLDDVENFRELMDCFEKVKMSTEEMHDLFTIVVAVMHLGNVAFSELDASSSEISASETSKRSLERAATLLQIKKGELADRLCSRTIKVKSSGEEMSVPMNTKKSCMARDALAKELYARMFNFLVKRLNKSLSITEHSANSTDAIVKGNIGVLDIFGFEIFEQNKFEQMCINFVNEKLQQYYNQHTFEQEEAMYISEGIEFKNITFSSNLGVLELFEKRISGVFSILDEEGIRPSGSDKSFRRKLNTKNKHSNHLSISKIQNEFFTVKHFAGTVTYSIDNFVDLNRDRLLPSLVSMLQSSSSSFVNSLFPPQQTKLRNTKKAAITLSANLRNQLGVLMKMLNQTSPHFIRCIKPNNERKRKLIDEKLVTHQLSCLGVIDALEVQQKGYPVRMKYADFAKTYRFSAFGSTSANTVFSNPKAEVEAILRNLSASNETLLECKFGRTMIFFKPTQSTCLKVLRVRAESSAAVKIQSFRRGVSARVNIYSRLLQLRNELRNAIHSFETQGFHILENVLIRAEKAGVVGWPDVRKGRQDLQLARERESIAIRLTDITQSWDNKVYGIEESGDDMLPKLEKTLDTAHKIGLGNTERYRDILGLAMTIQSAARERDKVRDLLRTSIYNSHVDELAISIESAESAIRVHGPHFCEQLLAEARKTLHEIAREENFIRQLRAALSNGMSVNLLGGFSTETIEFEHLAAAVQDAVNGKLTTALGIRLLKVSRVVHDLRIALVTEDWQKVKLLLETSVTEEVEEEASREIYCIREEFNDRNLCSLLLEEIASGGLHGEIGLGQVEDIETDSIEEVIRDATPAQKSLKTAMALTMAHTILRVRLAAKSLDWSYLLETVKSAAALSRGEDKYDIDFSPFNRELERCEEELKYQHILSLLEETFDWGILSVENDPKSIDIDRIDEVIDEVAASGYSAPHFLDMLQAVRNARNLRAAMRMGNWDSVRVLLEKALHHTNTFPSPKECNEELRVVKVMLSCFEFIEAAKSALSKGRPVQVESGLLNVSCITFASLQRAVEQGDSLTAMTVEAKRYMSSVKVMIQLRQAVAQSNWDSTKIILDESVFLRSVPKEAHDEIMQVKNALRNAMALRQITAALKKGTASCSPVTKMFVTKDIQVSKAETEIELGKEILTQNRCGELQLLISFGEFICDMRRYLISDSWDIIMQFMRGIQVKDAEETGVDYSSHIVRPTLEVTNILKQKGRSADEKSLINSLLSSKKYPVLVKEVSVVLREMQRRSVCAMLTDALSSNRLRMADLVVDTVEVKAVVRINCKWESPKELSELPHSLSGNGTGSSSVTRSNSVVDQALTMMMLYNEDRVFITSDNSNVLQKLKLAVAAAEKAELNFPSDILLQDSGKAMLAVREALCSGDQSSIQKAINVADNMALSPLAAAELSMAKNALKTKLILTGLCKAILRGKAEIDADGHLDISKLEVAYLERTLQKSEEIIDSQKASGNPTSHDHSLFDQVLPYIRAASLSLTLRRALMEDDMESVNRCCQTANNSEMELPDIVKDEVQIAKREAQLRLILEDLTAAMASGSAVGGTGDNDITTVSSRHLEAAIVKAQRLGRSLGSPPPMLTSYIECAHILLNIRKTWRGSDWGGMEEFLVKADIFLQSHDFQSRLSDGQNIPRIALEEIEAAKKEYEFRMLISELNISQRKGKQALERHGTVDAVRAHASKITSLGSTALKFLDRSLLVETLREANEIGIHFDNEERIRILCALPDSSFLDVKLRTALAMNNPKMVSEVTFAIKSREMENEWGKYTLSSCPYIRPGVNLDEWTNTPVKIPLTQLREEQFALGAKLSKLILGYMRDRYYPYPLGCLNEIVKCGVVFPDTRDEIYCQLCKQLTNNPNDISSRYGWELMTTCISFFPPGNEFENYLEAFLREHDRIDLVISLHKIVFTGANEKLPSLRDLKREEKAAEESYSYNNY